MIPNSAVWVSWAPLLVSQFRHDDVADIVEVDDPYHRLLFLQRSHLGKASRNLRPLQDEANRRVLEVVLRRSTSMLTLSNCFRSCDLPPYMSSVCKQEIEFEVPKRASNHCHQESGFIKLLGGRLQFHMPRTNCFEEISRVTS